MRIFLLLFVGFPFILQAQSVEEIRLDTCGTAPLFFNQVAPNCDTNSLDSNCFIMNSAAGNPYSGQPWPGCNSWGLHNPSWIPFIGADSYTEFNIYVSDCNQNDGAQFAFYEIPAEYGFHPDSMGINPDVLRDYLIGDCTLSTCNTGNVNISIETEAGKQYILLIDGCNGDVCTVEIQQLNTGELPNLDTILQDQEIRTYFDSNFVCKGSSPKFNLRDHQDGINAYLWSKNGLPIPGSDFDKSEFIDFPDTGKFEICVAATNYCDTSEKICTNVIVERLDTFFQFDTVCESRIYSWRYPGSISLGTFGPFDSLGGKTLIFDTVSIDRSGCEAPVQLELFIENENDESPIAIDTFTNVKDLPIRILNKNYYRPVKNELRYLYPDKCREYYNVNIFVFGGDFYIDAKCLDSDSIEFSLDVYNSSKISDWEDQLLKIENNPSFELDLKWIVDSFIVGNREKLILSRQELAEYALDSMVTIKLNVSLKYNGIVFFEETDFRSIYLRYLFHEINSEIRKINDSTLAAVDQIPFYQWLRCDSNFKAIPYTHFPEFKPKESGYYAVELSLGLFGANCNDTSECIYFSTTTATSNQIEESIRIIPNPTSGQFKIGPIPNSLLGEQYSIYSMTGDLLIRNRMIERSIFDLSAYPAGIYILKIKNRVLRIVKI